MISHLLSPSYYLQLYPLSGRALDLGSRMCVSVLFFEEGKIVRNFRNSIRVGRKKMPPLPSSFASFGGSSRVYFFATN